jgi:membrane-bound ClpP family serine protease
MVMNRFRKIPRRVFLRYLLLQIPGTAALAVILGLVGRGYGISPGLIVLIVVLWVLKDLAVFPFVWKSYDAERPGISGVITGVEGTVVERLSPAGRIRVRGENWKAERIGGEEAIEKGAPVRVVGRSGLTLLVEPAGNEKPHRPARRPDGGKG